MCWTDLYKDVGEITYRSLGDPRTVTSLTRPTSARAGENDDLPLYSSYEGPSVGASRRVITAALIEIVMRLAEDSISTISPSIRLQVGEPLSPLLSVRPLGSSSADVNLISL